MRKINYGGWPNCIELSNGQIDLIATTDVGPRVIRLGFKGGQNFFKENVEQIGQTGGNEFVAYGGHRFWHSPEVAPRTYAPDNGPVEYQWKNGTLHLIQPVEATTGLRKELEITVSPAANQVKVLHRLTNTNLWAIEAAPWALSVMAGPGRAIFPQEPFKKAFLPVRPLVLWGYTDMSDARYVWGKKFLQMNCNPDARTPQKIGMANTVGWAAYERKGEVFLKRFGFDREAVYPDFGCNAECYTDGDMLEVETLGPLSRIEPESAVEHVEHWFLHKNSVGKDEAQIEKDLLPLLKDSQPL